MIDRIDLTYIVRANSRKAQSGSISHVLILNTCTVNQTSQEEPVPYLHPLKPPLPVLRNLPVQLLGSHASILIRDSFEVATSSAARHNSVETTCDGLAHVGSLSGNERFVPAGTCCENHTLAFGIFNEAPSASHRLWKEPVEAPPTPSDCTAAAATKRAVETTFVCHIVKYPVMLETFPWSSSSFMSKCHD